MDENYLTVVDEDGNEILCEILFTFESDETDKAYVFYVPVEGVDDDSEVEVLCSSYIPEEDGSIGQLFEIDSDEEWDMIEEIFDNYMSSYDDEEDDECSCEDEEDDECCCEDDDDDECCCHKDENKK